MSEHRPGTILMGLGAFATIAAYAIWRASNTESTPAPNAESESTEEAEPSADVAKAHAFTLDETVLTCTITPVTDPGTSADISHATIVVDARRIDEPRRARLAEQYNRNLNSTIVHFAILRDIFKGFGELHDMWIAFLLNDGFGYPGLHNVRRTMELIKATALNQSPAHARELALNLFNLYRRDFH